MNYFLLFSNLAMFICMAISFTYGVVRFFKKGKALYLQMIVGGLGCMMLGRAFQVVTLLTRGMLPEGFHIGTLGIMGGFLFFLVLPLKRGFSGSVKLTVIFAIAYIVVKTLISIITYDENGGKTKNVKNSSGKKSSKPQKTAPAPTKSTKATKKMKDEEYTRLFTPKSN